jgi:HK97 family phage prohead protease
MEVKNLSYKIVDIDNQKRLVKAYFSAFDNIDNDGDIMKRGCFVKTINENGPAGKDKIKHFLNHECFRKNDLGAVVGFNPSAIPLGKVIELGEDQHGGYFVSKIARTQQAEDIYNMYVDGMINEHSFTMQVIPSKLSKTQAGNRIIGEAKLLEVSTVTLWPSNDDAYTIDVKTAANLSTEPHINNALFIEPSRSTLAEEAAMKEIAKLFLTTNIFKTI